MEKYLSAVLVVQDLGITQNDISSLELASGFQYERFDRRPIEKLRLFLTRPLPHLDWKQEEEDNWLSFETTVHQTGYEFKVTIYAQKN
jgi:hypothetical protein